MSDPQNQKRKKKQLSKQILRQIAMRKQPPRGGWWLFSKQLTKCEFSIW
jgi:hypothetical protein